VTGGNRQGSERGCVSRKAWIWTLAAIGLIAFLAWAWLDGGERPLEWIEEPVELPADAG